MLQTLRDIAPLIQWAQVAAAAALLLVGFTAYGHYRVRKDGYGDRFGGIVGSGAIERALRWCVLCLSLGLAFWGIAIGWPTVVLAILAGIAAVLFAVEAAIQVGSTIDTAVGGREREG